MHQSTWVVLVRLAVLKAWGQTTKFRIFYVVILCICTYEYVIDTNTGFNATAKRVHCWFIDCTREQIESSRYLLWPLMCLLDASNQSRRYMLFSRKKSSIIAEFCHVVPHWFLDNISRLVALKFISYYQSIW